jgi:hypothetical protein
MIDRLYNELRAGITVSRLKEISIAVIARYKRKDHAFLNRFARDRGIDSRRDDANRIFARIIQIFHPDRINKILNEIEDHYRRKNVAALKRMQELYLFDSAGIYESAAASEVRHGDYSCDVQEDFDYTDDDFGYDEDSFDGDAAGEDEDAEYFNAGEDDDVYRSEEEYTFIDAVTHHFVGNLDYRLTPDDLKNLDGELDLSGSDIDDLSGVEHCAHLSVLNLSGNNLVRITLLGRLVNLDLLYLSENRIEDISCLRGLSELRELDVSFNYIEDISPLLELKSLNYVNLVNNPVGNKKIIDELTARGILVIY